MEHKPLYRFSPITTQHQFEQALAYVATTAGKLTEQIIGQKLPLDTLTLFAHYDEEYTFLERIIRQYGSQSRFTHGSTLYVDSDFEVAANHIKILGVRRLDPYRMHVGYGDYPVDDYQAIRRQQQANPWLREITSGGGGSLLELWHPDFDILGYIVAKEDHANG